jgi:hypothetical protein
VLAAREVVVVTAAVVEGTVVAGRKKKPRVSQLLDAFLR